MDRALDVFLQHPSRYVTAPDGSRWHVDLARGNAASPPAWAYRVFSLTRPQGLGDDSDVMLHPVLTLPALFGPPALVRWLAYRLRRREDWRAVVRPATAVLLSEAVVDRSCPDKRSAGALALELLRDIASGRFVPSGTERPTAP